MSGRSTPAAISPENPNQETEDFDIVEPTANLLEYNASGTFELEDENGMPIHPPIVPKPAQLTFWNVFAIFVGMAIGSGIFASPSRVDSNVPSPGVAIVIWVVAGTIGWAGATSFAELGAAIPKNGGIQEYLRYIYGDFLASIMSWTWIIVIKPSSAAIISIIFAEYWTSILNPSGSKPFWMVKLLALITISCVLLINCVSAKSSTGLTNVLVYSKLSTVSLILLLAVPAMIWADKNEPVEDWKSRNWFASRGKDVDGSSVDWKNLSSWDLLGYLTTALYAALWSCGGWDNVNLVVAEMRDPFRDLPRAVHTAIPTITLCFVLTNLAYYIILPWKVLRASDAIAVAVGRQALGNLGGLAFAILVSASCLGVLNIEVYTSGILTSMSARHGYLPVFLADPGYQGRSSQRNRQTHDTTKFVGMFGQLKRIVANLFSFNQSSLPIRAMVFNTLTACPYILLGTFGPLVTLSGIAGYVFLFLAVFGVLVLRVRQPSLKRPYKSIIAAPIFFCLCTAFLVVRGLIYAPMQAVFLALLMVAGGMVHFYKRFA